MEPNISLFDYLEERTNVWKKKSSDVSSGWKKKEPQNEVDRIKEIDKETEKFDTSVQSANPNETIEQFKKNYVSRYTMEIVNAGASNPEKISLADVAIKNFFSSLKESLLLRNDIEIAVLKEAVIHLSFQYGSNWQFQVRTDTIARPTEEIKKMKELFDVDSTIKLKLNVISIMQNDEDVTKSLIEKLNKEKLSNELEENKIKNTDKIFKLKKKYPLKTKNIDATGFIDIVKSIFDMTNKNVQK